MKRLTRFNGGSQLQSVMPTCGRCGSTDWVGEVEEYGRLCGACANRALDLVLVIESQILDAFDIGGRGSEGGGEDAG